MIVDGVDVVYTGSVSKGTPAPGDEGKVLVADDIAAHVTWRTGALAHQVSVVYVSDLENRQVSGSTREVRKHLKESLDLPMDAEEALDDLTQQGHLGRLSVLADETAEWVEAHLREMDTIRRHASATDDSDSFIKAATRKVLREALEALEDGDV